MRTASKYKHVFGQPSRKDACYENVRVTTSAHDGSLCAVNPRFLAVASEASGGAAFLVLQLKKVGRVEATAPRVFGHTAPINELKWSPFNDFVIASCSDDATVKVWNIPEHGLATSITQCAADLRGHSRRATYIEWHPTAEHLLLSAGFDYKCIVWNVKTAVAVSVIQCHDNAIYSLSWNRDGSLFATTCKDKKIRVIDPRSRRVVQEGDGHAGLKPSKLVFVTTSNLLFSTGFSKRGDREIALWDGGDLSHPLILDTVDYSSGVLLPFYDPDTQVVYVAGKGDGNIRFYEIEDDPPHVRFLSQYPSADPQRALGWMPKRGLDTNKCEVARFYKLHADKQVIEPLPMIVPRRSSEYQEDIYPPTADFRPSLTAEEWLSGITRGPTLVPLKDVYVPTPAKHSSSAKQSIFPKCEKSFEQPMSSVAAQEVRLPACAPASLRNILKLSTDSSHVMAAPMAGANPTSSSAKNGSSATKEGSSSAKDGGAAAVSDTVASAHLADSDCAPERSVLDGQHDGKNVASFPDGAVAGPCSSATLSDSSLSPAVEGDDTFNGQRADIQGSAYPQLQPELLPGSATLASPDSGSQISTPDSVKNVAHHPGASDSLSAKGDLIRNEHSPSDGHGEAAPAEREFRRARSTEKEHPVAGPVASAMQQQQRSNVRPKSWRDNSAWQQPALPVQPPDEAPATLPRRLHSGRLIQPQIPGHAATIEKNDVVSSGGLYSTLVSPPREVNGSNLSNDELHKTYFKQVEEIKFLRQQLAAKEKKIQELESELEQVRKPIPDSDVGTAGLVRCGHS